jgi:hypothetical protein
VTVTAWVALGTGAVRRRLVIRHTRHRRGRRRRVFGAGEIAPHQEQVEHHAGGQQSDDTSHSVQYTRVDASRCPAQDALCHPFASPPLETSRSITRDGAD